MLAEALSRLVKAKHKKELAFVWISINYLHKQSKDKLEEYFANERLVDCIGINEISNNQIEQNQIVFVNWESLNKEGIALFMIENEKDWNLNKVIEHHDAIPRREKRCAKRDALISSPAGNQSFHGLAASIQRNNTNSSPATPRNKIGNPSAIHAGIDHHKFSFLSF